MAQTQLSYVTLGVSDLERARRFYRDGLGLAIVRDSAELVFIDLGGVRLALYPALAEETGRAVHAARAGHSTLSLNLTRRADVDRLLSRGVDQGGTLLRPADEPAWGGYRGYLADPDGFVWELVWHPDYSFR